MSNGRNKKLSLKFKKTLQRAYSAGLHALVQAYTLQYISVSTLFETSACLHSSVHQSAYTHQHISAPTRFDTSACLNSLKHQRAYMREQRRFERVSSITPLSCFMTTLSRLCFISIRKAVHVCACACVSVCARRSHVTSELHIDRHTHKFGGITCA